MTLLALFGGGGPLTITDFASRYLLTCEALSATQEKFAFTVFTKPAAANVLQQQAQFDAFVDESPRRRLRAIPACLPGTC